nr:hypothetical protein [Tanacetum cinerariifolium]
MEVPVGFDEEPKAPPSSDYEPEQEPLSPNYVHEPEYPKYLVPSDTEAPMEDQPLPDDASPTALSPGYVVDSDSREDPEEDPEEDPVGYPTDRGDNDDDESSDKDDDDVDEDDEEEEERLALTESIALHAIDPVSSVEDTKAFTTDELAPPPIPSHKHCTARMSIRPPTPMSATIEALIVEYASAPTPPSPPPSPLSYRAPMIRLKAASPPTHHPSEIPSPPLLLPSTSHKDDLPESLAAAAARQPVLDVATIDTTLGRLMSREDDRALQRGRVNMLFRDKRFHRHIAMLLESEVGHAQEAWSHSMDCSRAVHAPSILSIVIIDFTSVVYFTKMPPKKRTSTTTTTTTPMIDAQLKALIAQGVTDALAETKANRTSRNGVDNHDSRTGSRRTERAARD